MENKIIKKIVFLGGATWEEDSQTFKDAFETAKLLAEHEYEIVNGGGPGVMRASTLGAKTVGGSVLAITYHRTKVLLQNSDLHIVFNGGTGTLSEWGMTWASSRIHAGNNKPIVLFGEFWKKILAVIKENMLIRPGEMELLKICTTPQEVLDYIEHLNSIFGPQKEDISTILS
jgi:predicted Rossmann-fold nucleotide-binding protein